MVWGISTAVVLLASIGLFCYWFRYVCLLILAAQPAREYSRDVVALSQLGFPEVRSKLQEGTVEDLHPLHRSLERDYAILTRLLVHAANAQSEDRVERSMLAIHYRVMSIWFRLAHRLSVEAASEALEEMSSVVAHFANVVGESWQRPNGALGV
jgi:hypothetical protein